MLSSIKNQYFESSIHYHFLKDFIYLFSERGEGSEKERKRDVPGQDKPQSVASLEPPTGDNPGVCPDRELNR